MPAKTTRRKPITQPTNPASGDPPPDLLDRFLQMLRRSEHPAVRAWASKFDQPAAGKPARGGRKK